MGNILRWATRPFILIAMFATRARALYKVSKAFFHFTICVDTQLYLNIFSIGFSSYNDKTIVFVSGKRCQMYEGRLYDIQCFASICAVSRCDACQKVIKGNVQSVKDNNKCYHSTCYQCYMCHKTLQGVQHFTAENKMRICVPCLTG